MPRLALAAAGLIAASLAAQPAVAQRSGTYAVMGVAVDGTAYEGSATLAATGPQTWRINWRVGSDTSAGVAITVGNMLVVGYVAGRETGAAYYEVQANGNLVGRWTQGRNGGLGSETLLPR
ncbi:hypothetical protein [Sediminicoccus sp. KRV36]|uniref:hypothetical protein n=1 Tax=Sediminicoccus sp. KRV36 TaxID=3133721 RepID=UPI00200FC2B4|nr:hypothetical protein [Sediminicoccus rosea]UPY36360.1 hypothetical protein LHU95_19405 [Sediminicoccus rosea]